MYMLNTENFEWIELHANYTSGIAPCPRDSFGFDTIAENVFVFGGETYIGSSTGTLNFHLDEKLLMP
jgi:hypothetical protein